MNATVKSKQFQVFFLKNTYLDNKLKVVCWVNTEPSVDQLIFVRLIDAGGKTNHLKFSLKARENRTRISPILPYGVNKGQKDKRDI